MANVKKQDYEYIANIFNESGDKAAQEYICYRQVFLEKFWQIFFPNYLVNICHFFYH